MMPRRVLGIAAIIIVGAMAVRAADQTKPQWRKITTPSGEIVIFGDIARAGFYQIAERGLSLRQLVVSAGIPEKHDGLIVHVRRHTGKAEAQVIEALLQQQQQLDDAIALEPNDVVQVTGSRPAE